MSKHADPNKPVDSTAVSGTPLNADATAATDSAATADNTAHAVAPGVARKSRDGEVVLSFDNLKVCLLYTSPSPRDS